MALAPFLPPVVPPSIPFPGNRGQDVAFVPSGKYRRDMSIPTPRTASPIPSDFVRPTQGLRPPLAQPPSDGYFDPAAIADALDQGANTAERLLRDLGRWIGDQWGHWNSRKTLGGSEAAYSRGAYTGSYNPGTTNTFDLMVDGIFYSYKTFGGSLLPLTETYKSQVHISHANVPIGRFVYVESWPYTETITSGGISYDIYNNDAGFDEIVTRYLLPDGSSLSAKERGAGMYAANTKWTIRVTPASHVGAVPYLPDIPAVPPVPDPAAQNPYLDPEKLPPLFPAVTPTQAPIRQPLYTPAPDDAKPITEEVPAAAGPARQLTRQVGLLPRVAPGLVPRIAPMPTRPIPQYLPETTPQGLPQLAPAPEPQTTPSGQRQYGPRTVTTTGVRPDLQGIAEEVGRIEFKLALVLGDLDQMGPFDLPPFTYGPGAYTLEPVCEVDSQGIPAPAREASWPGGSGELAQLGAKIDALAELLQFHKELKQPICRGNPPAGQPVTVTFEEEPA